MIDLMAGLLVEFAEISILSHTRCIDCDSDIWKGQTAMMPGSIDARGAVWCMACGLIEDRDAVPVAPVAQQLDESYAIGTAYQGRVLVSRIDLGQDWTGSTLQIMLFAADRYDTSAPFTGLEFDGNRAIDTEDSRCPHCYLGAEHTKARHAMVLEQVQAGRRVQWGR